MPRVPVVDAQRVEQAGPRPEYSNLNTRGAFDSGGQEIAQLGAAIQRAKDRADQVNVNDALTQYQHVNTSEMDGNAEEGGQGFLATRGVDAAAQSGKTLENLSKSREQIMDTLGNDTQRKMFAQKSAGIFEGSRSRLESHVSQQRRVAEISSLKGRTDSAVQVVANDPTNDTLAASTVKDLEESTRKLADSPAEADANVAALKAQVVTTRIEALLSPDKKDWKSAGDLLLKHREELMPKQVAAYQKAVKEYQVSELGEKAAIDLVTKAKDDTTGKVNEAQVYSQVNLIPDKDVRDEARKYAEHQVELEKKAWKEQVDTHYDQAFSAMLKTHQITSVDPKTKVWLRDHDPDSWDKLEEKARGWARYWRSLNEGKKDKPSPEERQALLDFKVDLVTHPEKYADPEYTAARFTKEWGSNLHPSEFDGAGTAFAEAKKIKPEDAKGFSEFVEGRTQENPVLNSDKDAAKQYAARMGDYRAQFKRENKDRPEKEPTIEELNEMNLKAIKDVITDKGIFWDSTGPAYTQPLEKVDPGALRTQMKPGRGQAADGPTPGTAPTFRKPGSPNQSTAPDTNKPPAENWIRGKDKLGRPGRYNPATKKFIPD